MPNYINDEQMVYDLEIHQYRLTENAVNDILQDEELLINFDVLSRLVSNALYSHCLRMNLLQRDQYIWYLSLPNNRPYIKEALRMVFEDLIINRSNNVLITNRVEEFTRAYNLADKSRLGFSDRFENIDIMGEDY